MPGDVQDPDAPDSSIAGGPSAGSGGSPSDPAEPASGTEGGSSAQPGSEDDTDEQPDDDDRADEAGQDDGDSSGTPGGGSAPRDDDNAGSSGDPFFDALFGLINDIVQLEPIAAVGSLLAVLSAATAPDPEALGGLILLIDDANICDFDRATCDVACGLLVGQCRACAEDPTCHEAMDRTCGELTGDCH